MESNIKFVKLHSDVKTPKYMTKGAAGFDIAAFWGPDLSISKILNPQEMLIVPTGLKLEIPINFEAQVRPRSGLAFKYGISIVNSPGTIDSDFRGEVKVALINLGKADFEVKNGERIAQIVVSPIKRFDMIMVESLSETDRNEGGFGSTGS
jgi:dUTP pyrophosphatase